MSSLDKLKQEGRKGATFCTHLALEAFFEGEAMEVAKEILKAKPQMAPIVNLALRCFDHFENGESKEEWRKKCQAMKREVEEGPKRIATWMADDPKTGKRIMTLSYSDTIFQALVETAKGRSLEVAITEGRPLGEGTLLAKRLAYAGLPVTLGVDAAALTLLEGCDAAWIGADAVGEEYFVNKVGTRALVLGARVMQKPVYVLADPLKRWPKGREWEEGKHPAEEVLRGAEPPLTVINPYFEKVPLDWVELRGCH